MTDCQIVDLYWNRDQQAITETDRKYRSYCSSIARNILAIQEDAEEAVNDTWLGAWNAMPPHRPEKLSGFLGKLTRRISLNKWESARAAKRGGGEPELALEELSACIPSARDVEKELEAAELTQILNRFIKSLPQSERRVFLCRYWYLESVSDIAARFGFSQSKVKSMLFRTRNKLRAVLEKEGIVV